MICVLYVEGLHDGAERASAVEGFNGHVFWKAIWKADGMERCRTRHTGHVCMPRDEQA